MLILAPVLWQSYAVATRLGGILSQGEVSEVDTVSKQVTPKFGGATITISSGFMGTWTASGMSWMGHPSRHLLPRESVVAEDSDERETAILNCCAQPFAFVEVVFLAIQTCHRTTCHAPIH